MFALVLSGGLLAALVGTLIVIGRRRARAERARPVRPPRPDPPLVDRLFDPALCAFCDERGNHACPACQRRLCNEHNPWTPDRFCWPCEAEWDRGARKRAIVIAPLVLAGIVVVFGLFGAVAMVTGFASAKLIIVPLALGAPAYLKLERAMRRRFKPGSSLPSATIR